MSPTITPASSSYDGYFARFSVAQYQRMIELGIVTPEDRFELLEGYIVPAMPRGPLHDGAIDLVKDVLLPRAPFGWIVRIRQSVVLSDSQPEPDFAIVRGNARTYLSRHPGAADVGLLIEVADSSLLRDQRDKTRIYARAGIACYWIVNLVDQRIEVYTQPSGPTAVPAYNALQVYQPGDAVPLVLHGNTVGTVLAAELLP